MKEFRTTLPTEAEMHAAVATRNADYDGVFFYGVITTGVFCLPSCPARPARAENLRFFFDAQHASDAGLRACKRCRPLVTLESKQQLVEIAEYIRAHAGEPLTLEHLAQRLDMQPTQFQKAFKATFGVSPKVFQDALRLQTFKAALREGEDITGAIFSAGFGSTSRVYGTTLRSIGMTPSAYRAGAEGESISHACRETALGCLMMAATDRGVCFAQFGASQADLLGQLRTEFPNAQLVESQASTELDVWIAALDAHLSNNAPRPDLPLDLQGTAFQIKVWRYLLGVAEGDVISYGELALGIDKSKAVRAAASACAANRIAVLVPCHRVLRGDGSLGGYRWGIERKRALIDAERKRKAVRQ